VGWRKSLWHWRARRLLGDSRYLWNWQVEGGFGQVSVSVNWAGVFRSMNGMSKSNLSRKGHLSSFEFVCRG